MSQSIDERVVEMRFDNKQFEAGAAKTISTLQNLKKNLDFSKIGDSFNNINKSANKVDMSGLDQAVTGIRAKFSALEVVAITTLANITNSVVNSAKRWISAFTIEPIRTGFQEYETQINAIQTILANTQKEGTNIQQVNAALDELNTYADKTIYNFTEMTRNIGTFTAAGVDLKTSVSAIQGIANLAAVSGSNSQQASTAMYQLSQALATGTVRLMDWNSVVNAGMGGQLFQDALVETSRLLGTGADAAIEASGSFRASLEAGWLTSEVLTDTLKKFTTSGAAEYISKYTGLSKEAIESELELAKSTYGEAEAIDKAAEALAKKSGKNKDEIAQTLRFAQTAEDAATKVKTFTQLISTMKEAVQSGWSQSFRIIIGDFEEARKLFTEISNSFGAVISASAEARNKLLSEVFDKRDGRDLLIDSLRNSLQGLISVMKPVKEAFKEVFPPVTAKQVYGMIKAFHEFTENLKLSEKNSKNLKNAFKGLFDVVKLLGGGFISLVKLIIPIEKPIGAIGDGVLGLVGSLGKLLSSISKSIRSSELLSNAFGLLKKGSSALMGGLSGLIKTGVSFVEKLSKMEGVSKFIESVNNAFDRLYKKTGPVINSFIEWVENLFRSLFNFGELNVDKALEAVSDAFSNLSKKVDKFNFDKVGEAFDSLTKKIKSVLGFKVDNEGFTTFVENFKKYGEELKEAFTWDNLLDRLKRIMDVFGKFFNWVKENAAPALKYVMGVFGEFFNWTKEVLSTFFKDFNIGSALAAGGGLGVVYAMIKAAKALENLSSPLKAIPDLLGSVKGTLNAYQTELKAEALIKVAGAIAILAGALVLLSFADTDRLMGASVALTLIAGALAFACTKLLEALNKGRETNDAVRIFAKGLKSTMKKFGRAVEIKAIGGAVKKFAESIAIIAGSIIALGIMYNKDREAFKAGATAVGAIGGAMVAIMTVMSILANVLKNNGMKRFSQAAFGIAALSFSLILCISALDKLFKMEFPKDWKFKIAVLAGILAGLSVVALALGVASRIAGGSSLSALTILSISAFLMVTVSALDKLFKMDFPSNWQDRFTVLTGMFEALGALMIIIGVASRLAGGSLKATGTILSICVFIGVIVAALMVLTVIPTEKLIKGAISLGIVLATLGAALYGAGKITNGDAYKSVLAMAITVGAITAALAILAMIPLSTLVKSAASLGGILLALAINLNQASKVTNKKSLVAIASMVVSIAGITASLYILSQQPWENLLSAAASLSAVLLAMSGAFLITSKAKPNPTAIAAFLAASVSVGLIAFAIYKLADHPWQSLLAAAASLGLVLAAMSATMIICSVVGAAAPAALAGLLILDLFIANFALVLAALGKIFESEGAKALLSGGAEILVQIGQAIGDFVGAIINGVLTGITSALPQIATDLSNFMTNLQPFISGSKTIDAGMLASVAILVASIIALTAAEVVNGIANLFGLSLGNVAVELSDFMVKLMPFIAGSKMLDMESLEACKYLAGMIIALTGAEIVTGITRFFGLSGNLVTLGQELSQFGPYIRHFSETVRNVTPESVQGAASAAEIVATMANKLPAQDGLIQKIFGEKSLSEFGQELVSFGPSISKFASQVSEVTPESVQGAASAAKIMAELANNLPNSETLWNKIFGGGQVTLSEFGTELVKFGQAMSRFSESVSGVDVEQMNGAIAGFKSLVNLTKGMEDVSATSLVNFSNQLGQIGTDSVNKFVQAFTNAGPRATVAVNSLLISVSTALISGGAIIQNGARSVGVALCSGIQNGISQNQYGVISASIQLASSMANALRSALLTSNFNAIGQNVIQDLITGINSKGALALSTVGNLCVAIINRFKISLSSNVLKVFGQNVVLWIVQGMNNKRLAAVSSALQICNAIISAFSNNITQKKFIRIGQDAALGLKYGIESKIDEIAGAAIRAANKAVESARKELDEHSPSKVTWAIGKFFSIGLANGIVDNMNVIGDSSSKAADEAVNRMKDVIKTISEVVDDEDFDTQPVIAPVFDLSNVERGAKDIASLMNRTYDLSSVYNKAMDTSSSFNKTNTLKRNEEIKDPRFGSGDTFEFNQYNYSPKPLSRSEIYRQTNNQFSAFRMAVNKI